MRTANQLVEMLNVNMMSISVPSNKLSDSEIEELLDSGLIIAIENYDGSFSYESTDYARDIANSRN